MSLETSPPSLPQLEAKLKNWVPVETFLKLLNDYFGSERSAAEIAAYREKKKPAKKLRDEIAPVMRFVQLYELNGEIRFPQDSIFPDCWIRKSAQAAAEEIEVTIALGEEQYWLGKELNENGIGRGHLGIQDGTPKNLIEQKLSQRRAMYSTDEALRSVCDGIKKSLQDKQNLKGRYLVIEAPLRKLPNSRWKQIEDELKLAASNVNFDVIYIVGNQAEEPFGFQIK